MTVRIQSLCVDSRDPARLASFWQQVLGWRRTHEQDGEVVLEPPAGSAEDGVAPDLLFLRVPDDKAGKNRLHLDLRPDDQTREVARLEALGARRVDVGQSRDASWVVLADPEGNEFCVLRALPAQVLATTTGESANSRPTGGEGGLRVVRVTDAQVVATVGDLFDGPVDAAAVRRFVAEPGHHLLVAYRADRVAGFISGVETTHPDKGTEMFLYELSVAEGDRRQGVGRALTESLAALARERGCYAMWVGVDPDNDAALATYRSTGAADDGPFAMLTWAFDPAPTAGG